jgi:hypothetical protein
MSLFESPSKANPDVGALSREEGIRLFSHV